MTLAVGKENDPDHAPTKCHLEKKRKVAEKMRSLLRMRKGKLINVEPPTTQKSTPGRDKEPTDSQVSSFTMEAIDVGRHCHMQHTACSLRKCHSGWERRRTAVFAGWFLCKTDGTNKKKPARNLEMSIPE